MGKAKLYSITVFLVALLSLAGVFGYRQWQVYQKQAREARWTAEREKAAAAIADELGIQVTRVVATAEGGMVDLRYQVVDPDKAVFLFSDLDIVPKMIDEATGTTIALTALPHRHDLQSGLTYFILYRNVENVIKPGNEVTVVIGDIRMEHFQVHP